MKQPSFSYIMKCSVRSAEARKGRYSSETLPRERTLCPLFKKFFERKQIVAAIDFIDKQ